MIKISQEEVLRVLEKKKEPLSCSEICEVLEAEIVVINRALARLLKHNEIKAMEISRFEAKMRWGEKAPLRRVRLYYV